MSDTKTEAMRKLDEVLAKLDWLAGKVDALSKPAPRAAAPMSAGGVPTTLPNYGNSKGQPIAGADRQTLEFYIGGCRRSLGDPKKSNFHDKERAMLAALEAELARQSGDQVHGDGPPPHDDADAPAPF